MPPGEAAEQAVTLRDRHPELVGIAGHEAEWLFPGGLVRGTLIPRVRTPGGASRGHATTGPAEGTPDGSLELVGRTDGTVPLQDASATAPAP